MRTPNMNGSCRLLATLLLIGSLPAQAQTQPQTPTPTQGWQAPNPYRQVSAAQLSDVQAHGRAAYALHCASCHGADALRPTAEAPDLRRLNSLCIRLKDNTLARHCQQDVDAYYSESVQAGKVRAGVVHMPPWRDTLAPGTAWAIQLFVEAQPRPKPRTSTSVDAAQGH